MISVFIGRRALPETKGVGGCYKATGSGAQKNGGTNRENYSGLPPRRIAISIAIPIALIFSKYFYLASLTTYYTFYLINKFHVPVYLRPSARAGFVLDIKSMSAAENPSLASPAKNVASPSGCSGFPACPRSLERIQCSGPSSRIALA